MERRRKRKQRREKREKAGREEIRVIVKGSTLFK